ncbi:MAG: hypothetical protein IPM42_13240 [Saprospiraceae bacterium]|nr:hypothetical protein [Saprospiraceae bacterium]
MNQRLLALDVFRGMTIFFMILVNTPGSWSFVYAPLKHAKWDGCTPTDLVFPFFMFIVGVSMAISYSKFNDQSNSQWVKKAIIRGIKIIVIGILLAWFPFYTKNFEVVRLLGVLQRIGLGFMIGAILITWVKPKFLWHVSIAILILYWGIFLNTGENAFTLDGNPVRRLDLLLFGESHIYKGYGIPFDPEGLLSTLPAVVTIILGFCIGTVLLKESHVMHKIKIIALNGVICTLTGVFWHYFGFAINKPIWSSSYVLFTGGLAMLLLCGMIWIIDFLKYQKWTYVFQAFGKNPLVAYILSGLFVKTSLLIKIDDQNLYAWIFSKVFQPVFGDYNGSLMFALSFVLFIWLFVLILDRKGIIIKV